MASQQGTVPQGSDADKRWKKLDRRRRVSLIRGSEPKSDEEALTALGYARRMRGHTVLFALVGAVGSFLVALSISMLLEGDTTTTSWLMASGIGIGVGIGLGVARRFNIRRMERGAEETLGGTGLENHRTVAFSDDD